MAKGKSSSTKVERTNTGKRGSRKTSLTRLELFLMGKGPTAATSRRMHRDSFKTKVAR